MTSVRLPEELESRLENLSQKTHRTKTFYIKEALSKYLTDLEDTYEALDRIMQPDRKLYSSKEMIKILDND